MLAVLMMVLMMVNGGQSTAQSLSAGMKITQAAKIMPGEYRLEDKGGGILQVSGRDFTLDLSGIRILGPGKREGIGIHITDARNVTIKNAYVTGMRWGVVLERCVGVTLEDCNISHNGNLVPGTVIDESGGEAEDQHGGGILLRDSQKCSLKRCKAMYQWDGIDVVRSEDNIIEDGDYSYNNNWGVHFWASSRNTFRRNRAVWCTTGQGELWQALSGWQTYDAQAVAIDHNSNENLIEANDLRFGGDGIFIRANEGPLDPTTGIATPVRNGSHRNILRNNDCSFSPNNAIEVDFVDDTLIEGNNCSYSNYGMWLGYSRRSIVRNNIALHCTRRAVEIENGQNGVFENNYFGYPVSTQDDALVYLRQNGRDKTPSGPYRFTGNIFSGAKTGVLLRKTPALLENNRFYTFIGENVAVQADADSQVSEKNSIKAVSPALKVAGPQPTVIIKPGAWTTIRHKEIVPQANPTVVEMEGIPLWVKSVRKGTLTFWMPEDFWLRPAKEKVSLTIYDGKHALFSLPAQIEWPKEALRVTQVSPASAQPGETVTLEGVNLIELRDNPPARVLFNGKPVTLLSAAPEKLTFRAPEHLILTTRYNMLVQKGQGITSWPMEYTVNVPIEKRPKLVAARFEPTTLKVGELLKVTLEVQNDLPYAVPLMQTKPLTELKGTAIRGYNEAQAYWDFGMEEQKGALHLRITSNVPGKNHPGSWPWLFGFDRPMLGAGERASVTAYLRVETPGTIEFRTGLVAGGARFIDDNAFRTQITIIEK